MVVHENTDWIDRIDVELANWHVSIVELVSLIHETLALKTQSCHNANYVVTGGTGGCHYIWQPTVPPVTT